MVSRILARCATRSLGEAVGLASGSAARSEEGEHSTVVLRLGGAACSGGGSADLGGPGGVSAAAVRAAASLERSCCRSAMAFLRHSG